MSFIKRDENFDLPVPQEEVIMFYHNEFVAALKKFGYMKSPPSLLDLNVELLKHGAIGMFMDIAFVPFMFVDWDTMKVEDVMALDDKGNIFQSRIKMMQNPICEKILKDGLKTWITKGFLWKVNHDNKCSILWKWEKNERWKKIDELNLHFSFF